MSQHLWSNILIAIVDYGVGNVRSVQKALEQVAGERQEDGKAALSVALTADPEAILGATGVVLPGVGAFGECITNLRSADLEGIVHKVIAMGKPLLGICVGMQMLFDVSEEMGEWQGLGILPGRVVRFGDDLLVPQIGWNQLDVQRSDALLGGLPADSYAYFVHSYYCQVADCSDVVATAEYGIDYPAVVGRDNVWGIQCHPEKSQRVGLRILHNFLDIAVSYSGGSVP